MCLKLFLNVGLLLGLTNNRKKVLDYPSSFCFVPVKFWTKLVRFISILQSFVLTQIVLFCSCKVLDYPGSFCFDPAKFCTNPVRFVSFL
jgi:hypothetical protein